MPSARPSERRCLRTVRVKSRSLSVTKRVDPSAIGVTRAPSELVKVDDAVCSVSWPAEVPEGTAVDPKVEPQGVRCQMGAGDRTYELSSQGLTVEETVSSLEAVASA